MGVSPGQTAVATTAGGASTLADQPKQLVEQVAVLGTYGALFSERT
jgi:hypothetical protein